MNRMKGILMFWLSLSFAIISCDKPEPDAPEDEGETSKLKGVTLTLEKINATTAYFTGVVKQMTPDLIVGIHWDYDPIEHISNTTLVSTYDFYEGGKFLIQVNGLPSNNTVYYMPYVYRNGMTEYGDCLSFKTPNVTMTIDKVEVNGFEAIFQGVADLDGEGGILVSTDSQLSLKNYMTNMKPVPDEVDKTYKHRLTDLSSNTTYYYRTYHYDRVQSDYVYGKVNSFITGAPMITIDDVSVTSNEVTFTGNLALDCEGGILYTTDPNFSDLEACGIIDLSYKSEVPYLRKCFLLFNTTYYYCTFSVRNGEYELGKIKSFTTGSDLSVKDLALSSATDLSYNGAANCYIVSQAGLYKIKTVKGNDITKTLTDVASPVLLWETFGTDVTPSRMDLINGVCYKDGYLIFQTANTFKEGNAVIAVQDKDGKILWSWHIWMTDKPQAHVYKNNAGTMMDRNLGATSAMPGDVEALGLLYQWGRKDPFLGSSSISDEVQAMSTYGWETPVESDSSTGTIDYAIAHPTTFITENSENFDWYYTGSASTDTTRWTTSETSKSIYDPCPDGWRVPDGPKSKDGWWYKDGVWGCAGFRTGYDNFNYGYSFSISSPSTTWYPASGSRLRENGELLHVGFIGKYWSAYSYSDSSTQCGAFLYLTPNEVDTWSNAGRAGGLSVRCLQDSI